MSFPDPQSAYRETAVRSATPVGLVVLLYDRVIADCGRALAAVQQNDVGKRTSAISHALAILAQLQGTLDFEQGRDVARALDRFYSLARARLLEAQIKCSRALLEEQRTAFLSLREAWHKVDRDMNAGGSTQPSPSVTPVPAAPPVDGEVHGWRA